MLIDPLGLVFSCLTYGFLALGQLTTVGLLIPRWCTTNGDLSTSAALIMIFYSFLVLMAMISHTKCMTMNPGYTPPIPVPEQIPIQHIRFCQTCNQYKPDRSHHCRTCKKCIHKMDHHCPWVNNCVGSQNQKSFMLFLFYVKFVCIVTLLVMFTCAYWYIKVRGKRQKANIWVLLISSLTGCVAFSFIIFTTVMFHDQLDTIYKNQSEVEALKHFCGVLGSRENLKQSLGNPWHWFNPLVEPPKPNYKEKLVRESIEEKSISTKFYLIAETVDVLAFIGLFIYLKFCYPQLIQWNLLRRGFVIGKGFFCLWWRRVVIMGINGKLQGLQMEKLMLYRHSLKAAKQFRDYNFREFFLRKTREEFRSQFWKPEQSKEMIQLIKRQTTLQNMYPAPQSVMEQTEKESSLGFKKPK